MLSNKNCVICNSYIRDVVDKQFARGLMPCHVYDGIMARVDRSEKIVSEKLEEVCRCIEDGTIRKSQIKRLEELKADSVEKQKFRTLTVDDVIEHKRHYDFKLKNFVNFIDLKSGDIVSDETFIQMYPDTDVYVGQSGVTFKNCEIVNVKFPDKVVCENCDIKNVSFCSHLHPEYGIDKCKTVCDHVVRIIPPISIDGKIVVEKTYEYKDLIWQHQ